MYSTLLHLWLVEELAELVDGSTGCDEVARGGCLFAWNFSGNLEVHHPRCVGSITKNFVYYMYSQTQLYFTY